MSNKNQPKESNKYGSRLREMTAVLRKHGITGGLTPEKLRLILEDLGPTYRSCHCIPTFFRKAIVKN